MKYCSPYQVYCVHILTSCSQTLHDRRTRTELRTPLTRWHPHKKQPHKRSRFELCLTISSQTPGPAKSIVRRLLFSFPLYHICPRRLCCGPAGNHVLRRTIFCSNSMAPIPAWFKFVNLLNICLCSIDLA